MQRHALAWSVSQREQITSALQRLNWLPVHFRMPLQMLIYEAAWHLTRAKAAAARISFHVCTAERTLLVAALGLSFGENGEAGSLILGPSPAMRSYFKGNMAYTCCLAQGLSICRASVKDSLGDS